MHLSFQPIFITGKIFFLFLVVFFSPNIFHTQNLLPNGDFENFRVCPGSMQTIQNGDLIDWFQPVEDCTPDYFNECGTEHSSTIPANTMGYQNPFSGNGYIGLWAFIPPPASYAAYSREFIGCQLKTPLEKGKQYSVKMNISLANYSKWSLSGLGIAFTTYYPKVPNVNLFMLLKHQQYDAGKQMADTLNWMPIEFNFVATGEENYFILGNFDFSNRNAKKVPYDPEKIPFWRGAYYYIDSVSVEETNLVLPLEVPKIDSLAEKKKIFQEKYSDAFSNGYVLTRVFFDVDKYDLKPESDLSLDSVVVFMNLFPDLKIEIAGHTDSTATEPYNKILSQNRAEEVKKYFIGKGISESRMVPIGYASSKPLATNSTVPGRARNRRVDFRVIQ